MLRTETVETPAAKIYSENAVVILGKDGCAEIERAFSVIINGDEPPYPVPCGVQVITIGQSPKNTVSVTSRTPELLTLSLNRAVNTLKGTVEPLELPLRVPETTDEIGCMAAFAAGILLGEIGE